jgi:DNA-binding response OmpR family regulator
MKILVVDDDPDITSLYKTALEGPAGFEVETFNDPRKVLSNFKPHYYDISRDWWPVLEILASFFQGYQLS